MMSKIHFLVPPRMASFLAHLGQGIAGFHRDERGAEGLEKLLIVAAIVLPLLGVLIFFRNELGIWVEGLWSDMTSNADPTGTIPTP